MTSLIDFGNVCTDFDDKAPNDPLLEPTVLCGRIADVAGEPEDIASLLHSGQAAGDVAALPVHAA